MKTKRVFGLFAACLLALSGATAVAGEVTTVTPRDTGRLPESGVWTPERIDSARPIPWYDEAADLFLNSTPDEPPAGPPTAVPGGLPGQGGKAPQIYPEAAYNEMDFGADFGTKNVFDDTFLNKKTPLWKKTPWRAIGKLLITSASGGSGWCSASVISPNDVIVTAAHCCYDRGTGSWNQDFQFVPAMRGTQKPYGQFAWSTASVLTAWITGGGRKNDVCTIKLKPNGTTRVSRKVGWLGRSWNFGPIQHHLAFGYPGDIAGGKFKYECSAESYKNCGDNKVLAMGCSMKHGSSGGPWIRKFEKFASGANNYVNSVVSGWDGSCTGAYGKSFNGARFTSKNIVPLCSAAGC